MQNESGLRAAMEAIHAATDYTSRYTEGMSIGKAGPLRHVHYDKPLWEITDYFQTIQVPPEEVVRTIKDFKPGPHHLGVVTTDPEAAIAAYVPLGYRPARWAAEPVMVRSLVGFVPEESRCPVQQAEDEAQRALFNSVIDADEPHGQMGPQELHDARLRFYFVEQDSKCVCHGKAIQPFPEAVVIEPLRTHEEYRRRGIASALMGRVHADAAERGAMRSVIMASPMGEMLYAALGYEVVGYHQSFVP